MKTVIIGALMALTVTAAGAAENTDSANYMVPFCRIKQVANNDPMVFSLGRCYGVVMATMAMYQQMRWYETQGKARLDPNFCADIPLNVSLGQAL
jgi:hypothetical protein